ncbi:MAG: hypothetical protein HON90_10550 [Halobacteriovoraceae bacterium]|nr:hypothetical protein [Halobacteriovoraceae bacterium]
MILLVLPLSAYASFFDITQKRWASSAQILTNKNIPSTQNITEPAGTYQQILEIIYQDRSFNLHKDCLIYKIPSKLNVEGLLKVISVNYHVPCESVLMLKTKLTVSPVYNFSYELKKRKLLLSIDTKKFEYDLFNVVLNQKDKLYGHSGTHFTQPGISISFVDKKDGYKLKERDICFDVDDKCKIVQKDLCHLCPGKILESVASTCPSRYRRYCLSATCGTKGLPACIRGHKASGYKGNYCIPGSPIGFCKKPLKVFCENGELICR